MSCSSPTTEPWRISLADIDKDGPFSPFPGRGRLLTVVDGPVLALVVDGVEQVVEPRRPFAFTGDAEVTRIRPRGAGRRAEPDRRPGRSSSRSSPCSSSAAARPRCRSPTTRLRWSCREQARRGRPRALRRTTWSWARRGDRSLHARDDHPPARHEARRPPPGRADASERALHRVVRRQPPLRRHRPARPDDRAGCRRGTDGCRSTSTGRPGVERTRPCMSTSTAAPS